MIRSLTAIAALGAVAALAVPASGDVVEETVEYDLPDGTTAKGVAIYDNDADDYEGDRPGVLVVPEWWGLTDYPKMRARELAEEGYVTFVADMYGEGKTTGDPSEAGEWAGAAYGAGLETLAKPALEELKKLDGVDDAKLGAIGFCFGGSTVVAMAGSDYGSELSGVVSFHGGLSGDAAPTGDYSGPPMMILHGGADPMVKPDAFAAFVQKSIEAGVPISVVNFPGALHAFSNPEATQKAEELPAMKGMIAYDEQAATISIEVMEDFFEMTLGEPNDDD